MSDAVLRSIMATQNHCVTCRHWLFGDSSLDGHGICHREGEPESRFRVFGSSRYEQVLPKLGLETSPYFGCTEWATK